MGYGVSSSSLLVAIGLAPAIASASVHTAEIVTTLVSGIAHHQLGNVKRELVLPLAIPGVIGGVLGAYFLSSIPGNTIKPWVAGLLLAMGCLIVYRFFTRKEGGGWQTAVQAQDEPPRPGGRLPRRSGRRGMGSGGYAQPHPE